MKALLLAAGYGTRLRPLTEHTPKCLVPINGRPLLDYWLHLLFGQGISEVLINTHHLSEKVEQHVTASNWGARIRIAHEPRLLGTAGTVLRNRDLFGTRPVLVAHADNLAHFSLRAFGRAHLNQGARIALSMMTFRTDTPEQCGIVETDASGLVQAFHEKISDPPGNTANAAIYILNPEVAEFIAGLDMPAPDLSIDVIPAFVGRIATHAGDYVRDIGTHESLSRAERDVQELRHPFWPRGRDERKSA